MEEIPGDRRVLSNNNRKSSSFSFFKINEHIFDKITEISQLKGSTESIHVKLTLLEKIITRCERMIGKGQMVLLKLVLIPILLFVLNLVVKVTLRKLFKIKKEDFSSEYINETHYSIDKIITIIFFIVFLLLLYLLSYKDLSPNMFLFVMLLMVATSSGIRTYFEWKYERESKQFILIIGEMLLLVIIVLFILQFDLIGFLSN